MIYVACHGAGRFWLQPTAMFKGTWGEAGGIQLAAVAANCFGASGGVSNENVRVRT